MSEQILRTVEYTYRFDTDEMMSDDMTKKAFVPAKAVIREYIDMEAGLETLNGNKEITFVSGRGEIICVHSVPFDDPSELTGLAVAVWEQYRRDVTSDA